MSFDIRKEFENRIASILACNVELENKKISLEDKIYTLKVKNQCIRDIDLLTKEYPELCQHPALLKVKKFDQELNSPQCIFSS